MQPLTAYFDTIGLVQLLFVDHEHRVIKLSIVDTGLIKDARDSIPTKMLYQSNFIYDITHGVSIKSRWSTDETYNMKIAETLAIVACDYGLVEFKKTYVEN